MGKYIAYLAYKDSGVEWLGDVPEHWTVERLNDIASIKQSNVDKKSLANQDEVRLCNYVDVYYNSKITANLNFMKATASEEEIKKFQLQKDDVIITKDSESPDDIGIAALVIENVENLLCGYHLAIIRDANKLINGGFLYYALSSRPSCHQFLLAAKGVTRFGLSHSNIKNIQLSIPKIHEQQQIADFLDDKTAHLDMLIGQKQQMIVLLNEKRMALITQAVTKGLDLTVPMKDSGVEWLGDVPQHWGVSRAKFVSSIFVPQRNKPETNEVEGVAWVTMEDMKPDYIVSTRLKVSYQSALDAGTKVLNKGAVIASCVGNFGVVSINLVDVVINQQLQAFIPNDIHKEYLRNLVLISKQYFESIGTEATIIYVNQYGFENMPISLPPPNEQQQIADYLNTETQKIDDMITTVKQAIATLQEYRTALITAAVTGKIDVRGYKTMRDDWAAPVITEPQKP